MKQPLVSVIIPVYNAEKYLDECISSVINQTYNNLEILLINDGSLDNSLSICSKWKEKDKRVIVKSKANKGVSSARNLALHIAKGDYFVFLDADDYLDTNAIEQMINTIIETNTEIAFCAIQIFDDKHSVISSAYTNDIIDNETAIKQCFQKKESWVNTVWAKIFSRKAIIINRNLNLFNENLLVGEDYLWLMQILTKTATQKVSCINLPLYNYRRFSEMYSLSNFKSDNYITKKIDLLNADLQVLEIFNQLNNKQLQKMAKLRFLSEFINGEVIIYYTKGYKHLNTYRKQFQKPFYGVLKSKNIPLQTIIKHAIIHFMLYFHIPRKILEVLITKAENRRREQLYL